MVTGYFLAFNFQVSHISTEAVFPCDEKFESEISTEWAVVQVTTGYALLDRHITLLQFLNSCVE